MSARHGITALESLLSVAIVAIAGTALLSAVASSVRTSREIALVTIARGLADQLLEEVAALRQCRPDGAIPSRPTTIVNRADLAFIDHLHGWTESPAQDRFGRPLGSDGHLNSAGNEVLRTAGTAGDAALLGRFRRDVSVEKVVAENSAWRLAVGPAEEQTRFRRVTVRVQFAEDGRTRELAAVFRIVCHVPPAL